MIFVLDDIRCCWKEKVCVFVLYPFTASIYWWSGSIANIKGQAGRNFTSRNLKWDTKKSMKIWNISNSECYESRRITLDEWVFPRLWLLVGDQMNNIETIILFRLLLYNQILYFQWIEQWLVWLGLVSNIPIYIRGGVCDIFQIF